MIGNTRILTCAHRVITTVTETEPKVRFAISTQYMLASVPTAALIHVCTPTFATFHPTYSSPARQVPRSFVGQGGPADHEKGWGLLLGEDACLEEAANVCWDSCLYGAHLC